MVGYAQLLNAKWPIFVTNLSFVVPRILLHAKNRLGFCRRKQKQIYTRKTNEKNVENKGKKPREEEKCQAKKQLHKKTKIKKK
jgi:hypothetical protein